MFTPIVVHLSEYLYELYNFYSNFDSSVLFTTKFMNFSLENKSDQMIFN